MVRASTGRRAGTPNGKPAVVLHGGPGSGCTAAVRRMFDPDAYRIVLLDQRGAGRSLPRVDHETSGDSLSGRLPLVGREPPSGGFACIRLILRAS